MVTDRPNLTDRQAEVLRYLGCHFAQHQRFPTYREISEKVLGSTNPNAARYHVQTLAAKGLVTLDEAGYRPVAIIGLSPLIRSAVHRHVEALIGGGE
jgi:SOS-response transcriptional repressor LexA